MARPRSSGQRDRKVQPPRPPNAWILYRSHQFRLIRNGHERLSQAAISKIISDMWRRETDEVKRHFEKQAETRKAQHQEQYPDYRYCPKRKESKQNQKKSKGRDATPSDVDEDMDDNDDDHPPPMPAFVSIPYIHHTPSQTQPSLVPGYQHNMVMPQPFMIPYFPYGPGGPSPPMSAVPSPAPHVRSQSPLQPHSVASSSSSSSSQSSPTSESLASSSSLQLPANSMYPPSLPNSHYPSPNPYATLPLSTLLFQNPALSELPLASPRPQLRPTENMVAPAAPTWNDISTYFQAPDPQNSEGTVNLTPSTNETQNFTEFQQGVSSSSSYDSLQALLLRTDESGVFNLSNIESSALLTQPQGDLEITMGPQPATIDYSDDLFADFDFDDFQRQMDSLTEDSSGSSPVAASSIQDDLRSLFHAPGNPEVQAYMTAQQRQPSIFTQEMMSFLNFEAMEDSAENTAPAVSPAYVSTTVAPQQVSLQNFQVAPAIPIFTQTTNTPTVASGSSYVPPAGAINSSTRRVAGSWKPSFVMSHSQMDEPIPSWNL